MGTIVRKCVEIFLDEEEQEILEWKAAQMNEFLKYANAGEIPSGTEWTPEKIISGCFHDGMTLLKREYEVFLKQKNADGEKG